MWEGCPVGNGVGPVGTGVGRSDGRGVGSRVGACDGGLECEGKIVGTCVGDGVGGSVGCGKGMIVGAGVGGRVGEPVGRHVSEVGAFVPVGKLEGWYVGRGVGSGVGRCVGMGVGGCTGTWVGETVLLCPAAGARTRAQTARARQGIPPMVCKIKRAVVLRQSQRFGYYSSSEIREQLS